MLHAKLKAQSSSWKGATICYKFSQELSTLVISCQQTHINFQVNIIKWLKHESAMVTCMQNLNLA